MKIIKTAQGSLEWQKARLAKITGTCLEEVMGTPLAQRGLINFLLAEEATEQAKVTRPTAEMERGTAEEVFAIKAFEKKLKKKVTKVGLCISDEFPWLAYSPDGLIKDKEGKFSEGVEVKNPDSATMISYRLGNDLCDLKVPRKYKWQVVNAFLVNEDLQRLYFVVYDARFIEEDHKMHVVEVERSNPALQEALQEARTRLSAFREEWVRCRELVMPSNF